MSAKRVVVGITGATGVVYGVRLLERLREAGVETHLIISPWAVRTLLHETNYTKDDICRLATTVHAVNDMGAAISQRNAKADNAGWSFQSVQVTVVG